MSEVLYQQQLYAVLVDDELYMFSPGTSRELALEWIAAAHARVEEQTN